MKKTNLTSSPRLIGRCWSLEFLYSKTTLLLLIFMLPLAMFSQKLSEEQLQQQHLEKKEAYHQERLSKQNMENKSMTASEKEAMVYQRISDLENQKLLDAKRKALQSEGYSDAQIDNMFAENTLSRNAVNNSFVNTNFSNVTMSASDPLDNNVCADATPIVCGQTIAGDTSAADKDSSDMPSLCNGFTSSGTGGVWYSIVGDGSSLTASTCGALFDTVINIFTGTCGGTLTCVGGNDDFCSTQSQATWSTTDGETYYIYVSGFGSNEGSFDLSIINCTPPSNGLSCETAMSIGCGDTDSGNTVGSTATPPPSYCDVTFGGNALGVWYKLVGSGYPTTIDVGGYDTRLYVYTGDCGSLSCLIGDDDGGPGLESQVQFGTVSGDDYYIYVSGYNSSQGVYNIAVACDEPEPYVPNENSPQNDICTQATPITCFDGSVVGDTTYAQDWDEPFDDCGNSYGSVGVWYVLEGNGAFVTLDTCGNSLDTDLHVYEGSCGVLSCVTSNDDTFDSSCGSFQSRVEFEAVDGLFYYIYVSGWSSSDIGEFTLNISCLLNETPENDLAENAIAIDCGDTVQGDTTFATADDAPDEDCSEYSQTVGEGVWYSIVGDGSFITLETCGSPLDTKLLVLTGTPGSLTCFGGDDDAFDFPCSFQSRYTFESTPGVTYYIYVSGYVYSSGADTGAFTLSATCFSPPENDLCQDATEVFCGSNVLGYTTLSTDDNPYTDCSNSSFPSSTTEGVWHTFIGTGGDVVMSLCGSDYDTKINVYTGECGNLTCEAYNDDFCGLDSQVTVATEAGEEYYIYISGFAGDTGDYELNIDCICFADAGDCQTVYSGYDEASNTATLTATISYGVGPYDYVWSSVDGEVASTYDSALASNSIDVIPSEPTVYLVTITDANGCESSDSVFVNVWDVSCESGNSGNVDKVVVCHTNGNGTQFNLCVSPEAVQSHLDHGDLLGGCELERDCNNVEPPVVQDGLSCDTGFIVACGDTVSGSTVGFPTHDPGFCGTGTSNSAPGVWYKFIGDGSNVVASLCNSTYDTRINVYEGSCEALSCVVGDDDNGVNGVSCSTSFVLQSIVPFSTQVGRTYFIYVHGYSSNAGNYELEITCTSARSSGEVSSIDNYDWSMAPNPAKGKVTLDLANYLNSEVSINVMNVTGKVMYNTTIKDLQGSKHNLELNSLPAGMYFVRVAAQGQVSTKKLMIMR